MAISNNLVEINGKLVGGPVGFKPVYKITYRDGQPIVEFNPHETENRFRQTMLIYMRMPNERCFVSKKTE
jgi:hypothetical protein